MPDPALMQLAELARDLQLPLQRGRTGSGYWVAITLADNRRVEAIGTSYDLAAAVLLDQEFPGYLSWPDTEERP